jgi:hypothetical protein
MSDDRSKRGNQDRIRINIHEDFELRYWSKELGITAEELREMVQQLGTSAETIRQAVNRKSKGAGA